jgi:hypothetical protein
VTEVVRGVDCIGLIVAYLNPLVDPPVSGRVPSPRPARFYRVSAAGGPGFEDKVNFRATVTVEAWAADEPTAINDLLLAMAQLEAAPNEFDAECSAPVSLPDPDTGTPRFLSTVQLAVRGSVLTP